MLQHFEEMLAGVRYLVCTYAKGPSTAKDGHFQVTVYEMFGSDLNDEEAEYGGDEGASHIRLELLAIEAALKLIGSTAHPIVFLTRQKYIPDYAAEILGNGFKRRNGKPAANEDLWRRIAALDPESRIEWRFAERDYEDMIEEWKEEKEIENNIASALERDRD